MLTVRLTLINLFKYFAPFKWKFKWKRDINWERNFVWIFTSYLHADRLSKANRKRYRRKMRRIFSSIFIDLLYTECAATINRDINYNNLASDAGLARPIIRCLMIAASHRRGDSRNFEISVRSKVQTGLTTASYIVERGL